MKEEYKQTEEFKYICHIMNIKGDTEDKKHGYYKILKIDDFTFKWGSRNSQYYLSNNMGSVDINDYIKIFMM